MNKDTEIKEVKDQMRELADRLEALETVEQRNPKKGDVWECGGINYHVNEKLYMVEPNGIQAFEPAANYEHKNYLGTFGEVYVLRSDVEKDYVSKKELRQWAYSLPCSQMNTALSRDWRRSDISIFKLID